VSHTIVDRRSNPGGKSLGNRERFIRRARESIKKAVRDSVVERSVTSTGQQKVRIPIDGISEPHFRHDQNTIKDKYVLPGNKEFVVDDLLNKPLGGDGKGGASDSGNGEDDFEFILSKEEYAEILFDGLELPDFIKKSSKQAISTVRVRAGHSSSGTPARLDLERSMVNSVGRRIALKFPKLRKIKELEALLETEKDCQVRFDIMEQIERLRRKAAAVTFLDPIDLKYKKFDVKTKPMNQAVVFCVMDVSGSVDEYEKDMAKRFYMLLHMFLSVKYKNIDVVFIRHTTTAKECNEEEFFNSKESGGTMVSSAFMLVSQIIKERYPVEEWNIYCASASDGDNFAHDNQVVLKLLEDLLPKLQYFIYTELIPEVDMSHNITHGHGDMTNLWEVYNTLQKSYVNIVMKKLMFPSGIYAVFRAIFVREDI